MSDKLLTVKVQLGGEAYEASIDLANVRTPAFKAKLVDDLVSRVGRQVRTFAGANAPRPAAGAVSHSPERGGEDLRDIPPGPDLLRAIRAALIARGSNLTAWCRAQGVSRTFAISALTGKRNGPASHELRARLAAVAAPHPAAGAATLSPEGRGEEGAQR